MSTNDNQSSRAPFSFDIDVPMTSDDEPERKANQDDIADQREWLREIPYQHYKSDRPPSHLLTRE